MSDNVTRRACVYHRIRKRAGSNEGELVNANDKRVIITAFNRKSTTLKIKRTRASDNDDEYICEAIISTEPLVWDERVSGNKRGGVE